MEKVKGIRKVVFEVEEVITVSIALEHSLRHYSKLLSEAEKFGDLADCVEYWQTRISEIENVLSKLEKSCPSAL